MKNENNPFKKHEIAKQFDTVICKYAKFTPTSTEVIKGLEKFLNKLKKQDYRRVLIVTHGTINVIQSIIINTTNYGSVIDIIPKSHDTKEPMPENRNCGVMICKIEDNKIILMSAYNSLHLKDLDK